MIDTDALDAIEEAYGAAAGEWTGCDWTAHHVAGQDEDGNDEVWDLDGETAEGVAAMIAAAESGEDPPKHALDRGSLTRRQYIDALHDAKGWLEDVESAAKAAEECAAEAISLARSGDLRGALVAAKEASSAESEYGDDPTWGDFRRAIEEAIKNDEDRIARKLVNLNDAEYHARHVLAALEIDESEGDGLGCAREYAHMAYNEILAQIEKTKSASAV